MIRNYIRKMQFTRLLLPLLFPFILHSYPVKASFLTNNMQQTSGEKLETALAKLKKKYNKTFVFDAIEININKQVNIKDNGRLEDALEQLKAQGVGYKVVGDRVILNKIEEKATQVKQQVITGKVLSENNGVMDGTPGVSVREKGTQNFTVTNQNGEFRISVKEGAILVFSMIGFKAEEISVGQRTQLTVNLQVEVGNLSEVVVNGYQNINRKLYTGAATIVKGSDVKIGRAHV